MNPRYTVWVCYHSSGLMTVRFPYNKRLVRALSSIIPKEDMKFDAATAAWTMPDEYMAEVEALCASFLPDSPYRVVDELPPYIPFNPEEIL